MIFVEWYNLLLINCIRRIVLKMIIFMIIESSFIQHHLLLKMSLVILAPFNMLRYNFIIISAFLQLN